MPDPQLFGVGEFLESFNKNIGLKLPLLKIYCSKGLYSHLLKRRHLDCLEYIDKLSEIVMHPDFIGVNPNETSKSVEIVKQLEKNTLVGIKLEINGGYYYVSSIYSVANSKITRRLHSGRLKKYLDNI